MLALAIGFLAGCGQVGQTGNANAVQGSPDQNDGSGLAIGGNQMDAQGATGAGIGEATPQQREWLTLATGFMSRSEQQRDLQIALRARAATNPHYCPAAAFVPKRIDIAFDPEPEFARDGTMMRGTIVYRATMQGCAEPVLLTVFVDAIPNMPLRFRAGLAGTTFADADLQERAIPYAVAAARPLLPGCAQLSLIDTRRLGERPDSTGSLVPWSESWLVSGCGKLVATKLDFAPDRARNTMLVTADPSATRMLQTGSGIAAAGSATERSGGVNGAAPISPAGMVPRTVAAATGTSLMPLGGVDIPGAKVAGTCLSQLRSASPMTAPDHVECLKGLSPGLGATTVCSASRGQATGQMIATVTKVDAAANAVQFQCLVRAR